MTFDQALELLEIARGQDAATTRRAYLRKLKQHPPERDPEGFQRLREAYELVKHGTVVFDAAAWEQAAAFAEASKAAPEPQPESSSAPAEAPVPPPENEAQTEVEPEPFEPDDFDIMFGLHTNPLDLDSLPDEDFAAWCAKTSRDLAWPQVVQALLRRERYGEAAALAIGKYEAAARDPLAPRASSFWGPVLIATFVERDQPQLSRAVHKAFTSAHDASDRSDPVRYELLRELLRVQDALPTEVTQAIAKSLLERQSDSADTLLAVFARKHERLAKDAIQVLVNDAPMLANLYREVLTKPRSRLRRATGWIDQSWRFGGFGVFMLLRLLSTHDWGCSKSHEDQQARWVAAQVERPAEEFCGTHDTHPWCEGVLRWRKLEDCTQLRAAVRDIDEHYQQYAMYHTISRADVAAINFILQNTDSRCGSGGASGGASGTAGDKP